MSSKIFKLTIKSCIVLIIILICSIISFIIGYLTGLGPYSPLEVCKYDAYLTYEFRQKVQCLALTDKENCTLTDNDEVELETEYWEDLYHCDNYYK